MKSPPAARILFFAALATAACAAPPAEMTGHVGWRFNALDQLPTACDAAAREGKLVLLGLSGGSG